MALPRGRARARPAKRLRGRFLPSSRSLLVGLAIVVAAVGAYVLARETSAFAIRRIEVSGAPPAVAAQVRAALAPLLGSSLVGLDGGKVVRAVDALPTIVSVSYDRAFPHTLRLSVVPERPVAVARRGGEAWLVSARGRVVRRVDRAAEQALPRIWLPHATGLAAGGLLPPEHGGDAARALSFTSRFPYRIDSVTNSAGSLVFHLHSGIELRLGDASDMLLKLAVARRALRQLPAGTTYLDVGLPGRPVAGSAPPPAPTTPTTTSATGTSTVGTATATAATATTPSSTTAGVDPQVSGGG